MLVGRAGTILHCCWPLAQELLVPAVGPAVQGQPC